MNTSEFRSSADLDRLPHRLTTSEVCALGRISKVTLWRRIRDGVYSLASCDRGRQKLYDRDAVLRAFGMLKGITTATAATTGESDDWIVDPEVMNALRLRRSRRRMPEVDGR